jgi:hypothetical protein
VSLESARGGVKIWKGKPTRTLFKLLVEFRGEQALLQQSPWGELSHSVTFSRLRREKRCVGV